MENRDREDGSREAAESNKMMAATEEGEEKAAAERGNWSNKVDFFMSCVSYAVGLGNVWRFPFLCYENGGGAFLLPYVIMMLLVGMPVFFIEMAMGQFSSLGCLSVWKCVPAAKGLGYAMLLIGASVATFYNVIIAYALFYLFASFTTELPWKTCDNWWNTPACRVSKARVAPDPNATAPAARPFPYSGNLSDAYEYDDYQYDDDNVTFANASTTRPSEEYFYNRVLDISDGIDNLGHMQWALTLCLLLAWTLVFLSLVKGIQSSGKVVYVTSTFPYFVLVALFIRGVTLEGAMDGIVFYMKPDLSKLLLPKVWQDAAVQVFFSLGCSFGSLHTLCSYNPWHQNTLKDAVIVSWLDCLTSIFGGFVVFSVLGFMAQDAGTTVDKVVESGPGLAFIAYPEAVARMPAAPLWSVLFFAMVFMLGIGSEFTLFEAVITGLVDDLEKNIKNFRRYKTLLTLCLCIVCFLLGLPMVTQGGMHIVTLMNAFAANTNLLLVSLLEVIVIGHVYGVNNFLRDLKAMLGFPLNIYWKVSWYVVTPLILLCLIIFSLVMYVPLKYGDGEPYPAWALGLGWFHSIATLLPLVLYPLHYVYTVKGPLLKRIQLSLKPTRDWGPAQSAHRLEADYTSLAVPGPESEPMFTPKRAQAEESAL